MGSNEILQALEHDAAGRKSHALRCIGRQSGGNLVGVDEFQNAQRLFEQEGRSGRFTGAIRPGNHEHRGLLAAHSAVVSTGSALWRMGARVTDKVLKGLIGTSLLWQVMGEFRERVASRFGDLPKAGGLLMAINNSEELAGLIDAAKGRPAPFTRC